MNGINSPEIALTDVHVPRAGPAPVRWNLKPGFGFACAVMGTLLALLLFPQDVHEPGNLQLPALALAAGLLAPQVRAFFYSPTTVFHPVAVLAVSPVYWLLLDPIQSAYPMDSVGPDEVRLAFIAIGSFSSCVWLACIGRPWPLPRIFMGVTAIEISNRALYLIGVVAFILAFCRFAIPSAFNLQIMLASFMEGRWANPWGRGALGDWGAFLDHVSYFGYVVPPIAGLLARRLGLLHWRTIVMILLTLILLGLFSTGGGRRIVGVMAGSGVMAWFLSAKRPRIRDLMVLGGFGVALLMFMQLMIVYRNVGIGAAFAGNAPPRELPSYLSVDDNFLRLSQVIQILPEAQPHVGFRWVLWVAVRPVPRVMWPGKPVDMGFDLPAYLGAKGVSYSLSLIGELYVAFGLLGCAVGGLFLGAIARSVAQIASAGMKPSVLIFFSCALFAFFVGMRSGIELVLMSYGVLAWVLLVWLYGRVRL